jgi:hypothetical protein
MAEVQQSGNIFLNGFDLSGVLKTIEENATQDVLDATSFGTTTGFREFAAGLHERGISAEGFFSYNATDAFSVDKLLHDSMAASVERLLTYGLQDSIGVGELAVMMNLKHASYNVQETIGDIIMTTFEGKASNDTTQNGYARGIWLMSQTVTGAVNGTAYDDGAGATTGYFAFGAVASLGAEQARNTATSVDRYVRAIVTAIGGATNKVSVAIKTGYTG